MIPAEFTVLIALIGTNLPDMRGRFARGIDIGGTGVDPDGERAPLDIQGNTHTKHSHLYASPLVGSNFLAVSATSTSATAVANPFVAGGVTNPTPPTGVNETRPDNVACHMIIKAD